MLAIQTMLNHDFRNQPKPNKLKRYGIAIEILSHWGKLYFQKQNNRLEISIVCKIKSILTLGSTPVGLWAQA